MGEWLFCFVFVTVLYLVASDGDAVHKKSGSEERKYPIGDIKHCLSDAMFQKIQRYEVLPGMGWDNLQNKDSGMVIRFNYSQCKTTDDGRYLIPDEIVTVPIKSSQLETYAELFEHWSNYTSTTSSSINVEAGLNLKHFGISGKFSHESENIKNHQVRDKSVTTRVQARYVRYSAKLQPDASLSPNFKDRLKSIAMNIQLNKTAMANYESQLLVRDFGTHVVSSVDAGSAIVQLDQIKSSFTRDEKFSKSGFLASASASFFSVFSVSASYSHVTTTDMITKYQTARTHSKINSHGGQVFKPNNFSLNDWATEMGNDLVAMDKSGDPIYFLITSYTLPDLPPSVLYDLTQNVKTAVEEYYKYNIYRGCTDTDSPNFSFIANVDDGSCESPETNYTFGGVYQTCSQSGSLSQNLCSSLAQKNPLTGSYSCPSEYEAILLSAGSRTTQETRRHCHRSWFRKKCSNYFVTGTAMYSAYWCVAKGHIQQQSGFLFGGIYTSAVSNPLTQEKSCPLYFYPLRLGKDLKVCVSDDYELGYRYSIPFAGFFSCSTGNPLNFEKSVQQSSHPDAANLVHSLGSYLRSAAPNHWPKGCPNGFSSHLATIENNCEINYCAKAHAFSSQGLPVVRRPPFIALPTDAYIDTSIEYEFTIGEKGEVWTALTGADSDTNPATKTNADTYETSGLSTGGIVAISVCATLVCVVAALVIIRLKMRRSGLYRRIDRHYERDAYGSLSGDSARVEVNSD